MPSGARIIAAVLVLAAVVGSAGCGALFKKDYEYEEELYLAIDGTATVNVYASIESLVAFHGAPLDPSPDARPDRAAVRQMYSAAGVEVSTPTFFRRDGRRFVHVALDVADVRTLGTLEPFSWSSYAFDRQGDAFVYRQIVGRPSGSGRSRSWTGDEVVAIRLHLPSKVLFENGSSNVQRGNIVVWEQSLRDRLNGVPLEVRVEMAPESILYTTLLLFAGTIGAAALVFALVIWWVIRRGRQAVASDVRPLGE